MATVTPTTTRGEPKVSGRSETLGWVVWIDNAMVCVTDQELESINRQVAALTADIAEPIPDYPGDLLTEQMEHEE